MNERLLVLVTLSKWSGFFPLLLGKDEARMAGKFRGTAEIDSYALVFKAILHGASIQATGWP